MPDSVHVDTVTEVPALRRFGSVAEAFESVHNEPFIVPRAAEREFLGAHEPELLLSIMSQSAGGLFGYDEAGESVELSAVEASRQWASSSLKINILDAPLAELSKLLPEEGYRLLDGNWVSPVLTRAGTYTRLHVDPPSYGGGWMFLATGEKHWFLIDPEHLDALFDVEKRLLRDPSLEELLELVPRSALRQGVLSDGDLLVFPPGWMHRVKTLRDSVGLGGYCVREVEKGLAARYAAVLDAWGQLTLWK